MSRLLVLMSFIISSFSFASPKPRFDCQCGPFNNGGWKCDLVEFGHGRARILKSTVAGGMWGNDELIKKFVDSCEIDKKSAEAESQQRVGSCECRYTRVNNNWGEVELLYFPTSDTDTQYYHQFFPPNVSDERMVNACRESNQALENTSVCKQITARRCAFGLADCD